MWQYPMNYRGGIRHFNVKIIHNGTKTYEENVNNPYFALEGDLILDSAHQVIVIPVTHVEGVSASTNITFRKSSENLCLAYL